jgi:hypothetical protein
MAGLRPHEAAALGGIWRMSDADLELRQPDATPSTAIEDPPGTILGILRRTGPGLITAGAVVGSGELIATTKTGAQAGFWLLWLIVIGCVIKLFAQVEFGRYMMLSHGRFQPIGGWLALTKVFLALERLG